LLLKNTLKKEMADSNATAAAAAEELAQLQHECDQLMFWINYKVINQIVFPIDNVI